MNILNVVTCIHWMPSNVLVTDSIPSVHETSYDFVLVGETYYVWANTYKFEDYHTTQWVDDTHLIVR